MLQLLAMAESIATFALLVSVLGCLIGMATISSLSARLGRTENVLRELRSHVYAMGAWVDWLGRQRMEQDRAAQSALAQPQQAAAEESHAPASWVSPVANAAATPTVVALAQAKAAAAQHEARDDETVPLAVEDQATTEYPAAAPSPFAQVLPEPAPVAQTLEERIGLTWLTRVGAAIFILGAAYFFKYAVDNQWIGPVGRIAVGALLGVAVLGVSEHQRKRVNPLFANVLTGVGLALLYATAYASSAFYKLVPVSVAFAAVAATSVLGGLMALRHRAQAMLIVSLAAAFANPVLLSTGEDRPLALSGYIFAMTAGAIVLSIRAGFLASIWISVLGSVALLSSWYVKFFDLPDPAAMLMRKVDTTVHYFTLTARAVPLAATVVFSAAWYATAHALAKRKVDVFSSGTLTVVALLFAHVALSSLLYDHPLLLGCLMLPLAAASIAAFQREGIFWALFAPIGASFCALTYCALASRNDPLQLLLASSGWAATYAAAFAFVSRGNEEVKPIDQLVPSVGMVMFPLAILFAILLLPERASTFAWLIIALSAIASALALASGKGTFAGVASLISFVAMLCAALAQSGSFVTFAALWVLVYFVPLAVAMVARPSGPTAASAATASVSLLGYVALALTHDHSRTQQGLIVLAAVPFALALGLALRAKHPAAKWASNLFLALGAACLMGSVGLSQSGVTITVLWAALAAIAMVVAMADHNEAWFIGGLGILGFAAVRMLTCDLVIPIEEQSRFFETLGHDGSYAPRAFLNPRSISVIANVAVLLLAERTAKRFASPSSPIIRTLSLSAAHLGLLFVLVTDLRRLFTDVLTMPAVGDTAQFEKWVAAMSAYLETQSARLGVLTTMVLGIYAAALLAGGFAARSRFHRLGGLVLMSVTVGKLALWDIWNLPRAYQILVLVGIGGLMLGAGFLYARFGKRLLGLITSPQNPASAESQTPSHRA